MARKIIFFIHLLLIGCSSIQAIPEASDIPIINAEADESRCEFLDTVVGSQSDAFGGGITPRRNLTIGAKNDLRNKAFEIGANEVYLQDLTSAPIWSILGLKATQVIAVGKAYKCKQ